MFAYETTPAELRRLRRHLALPAKAGERTLSQVEILDTPEGELAAAGVRLARVRQGWEWQLEVVSQADGEGFAGRWQTAPGETGFACVADKTVRRRLEACAGRLQVVCRQQRRRESLQVDGASGPVLLLLENIRGEADGKRFIAARVELRALAEPAAAYRLARALLADFALWPCFAEPSPEWLCGRLPPPFKARPSLPETADAGSAFRHIARNCLLHFCGNLPGLLASDAPEYVHQARVAIRRLRSALKLFAPWLPTDFVAEFSARWRDLANALGDCRNLDVFLAETLPLMQRDLGASAVLARLRQAAEKRGRQARQAARAVLAAPATRLLLLDFSWALEHLEFPVDLPPLVRLARRRLVARAHQARRLGLAVRNLDPEARHQLRIAFKKLRYALEFFAGLFGAKRSARYLAGLADLQEVLGHLNDLATARQILDGVLGSSAARLPHAWLAGRSGALVDALPAAVGHFLAARAPWDDD